ncbi:glycoside hydrolase family 78 protein [Niabella hibiscisoli]
MVDPRCEYTVNPIGIETAQPLLSWEIQAFEKIRCRLLTGY